MKNKPLIVVLLICIVLAIFCAWFFNFKVYFSQSYFNSHALFPNLKKYLQKAPTSSPSIDTSFLNQTSS